MADGFHRLKRWWMRKYKLPASHDLFQTQTVAELLLEQYGDLLEEKAELESRLEADPSGRESGLVRERLLAIERAFGDVAEAGRDDLVEFWEAEIAAGRAPDLEMGPSDLQNGPDDH